MSAIDTTLLKDTNSNSLFLKRAVNDAQLMLAFATEHGLSIDDRLVEMVVQAKNWELNNEWTVEREIEFWSSYKLISKLIQPVTVDSLRCAQEREIEHFNWFKRLFISRSMSRSSVQFYQIFTILIMLTTAFVQIFSLKGATLLNTIQGSAKQIKESQKRMNELILIKDNKSVEMEKIQIESEMNELDDKYKSSIALLQEWVAWVSTIEDSKLKTNEQNRNTMIIQKAQNYVLILNLYFLPLLYGLLGGFVFVLRNLIEETKNLIFSKESNIKYALRVQLGAIAGLSVGLFWGDIEKQQLGFIENLSPLALAFIAGYSVEYLFSAVDKLVMNITKGKESIPQKTVETQQKTTVEVQHSPQKVETKNEKS